MTWLAQRTRAHGIVVPIIACAGQGELHGAGGDAHGVVPPGNLYPADDSTTLDAGTRYYSAELEQREDRKSTRLNSSHVAISYAVFCPKNKSKNEPHVAQRQ